MLVHFTQTFLDDLQHQGDANFPRRVLRKIFDHAGEFRIDGDDHRYQGIEDAWIRYVSQGGPAYRVIYIRRGEEIILYRAGPHAVEDRLPAEPIHVTSANYLIGQQFGMQPASMTRDDRPAGDRLLTNSQPKYLVHAIMGRRLIPHKEIILVSPFISSGLLLRTARFGRVLDDLIEDDCKVMLVTRPPKMMTEIPWLADLETRGIDLYFHPKLHAKIYLFRIDDTRLGYGRTASNAIIVGSANLTEWGIPFETGTGGGEELCYDLPDQEMEAVMGYITLLVTQSSDLAQMKIEFAKRRRS